MGRSVFVTETVTVHGAQLCGPLGFERSIAVHRLHPHLSSDERFVRQLVERLRALARCGPRSAVLGIEDIGWWRGQLCIMTPPLDGVPLSGLLGWLRRAGALQSVQACCHVAFEVAGALQALQAAGIGLVGPADEAGVRIRIDGQVTWVDRCLRSERGDSQGEPVVRAVSQLLRRLLGQHLAMAQRTGKEQALLAALHPIISIESASSGLESLRDLRGCLLRAAPRLRDGGPAEWAGLLRRMGPQESSTAPEVVGADETTVEIASATPAAPTRQLHRPLPVPVRGLREERSARWTGSSSDVQGAEFTLVVKRTPGTPSGVRLSLGARRRWVVGRAPAGQLVLDDPDVSRRHFEVVRDSGDSLWVRDLGSKNGLRINGAETTCHRLSRGDEISVGNTVLGVDDA